MKVIFKLDPKEQKSGELLELVKQLGEPKASPRRSNHPLDLLSELISSGLIKFYLLVHRLVSAVVKPRKPR